MGKSSISRSEDFFSAEVPLIKELLVNQEIQIQFHNLEKGASFVLIPKENESVFLYMLEGKLRMSSEFQETAMKQHDCIGLIEITKSVKFTMLDKAKCLTATAKGSGIGNGQKKYLISRREDFYDMEPSIVETLLNNSDVQVIFHGMRNNGSLGLIPVDGDTGFLYILEGRMKVISKSIEKILGRNDYLALEEMDESIRFIAMGATKCLSLTTKRYQYQEESSQFLSMIHKVEEKDVYTFGHSQRVGNYASTIALELDCDYDIVTLGRAAALHDIGKINVPSEILRKPGRLTEEEYNIIKRHPQDSYEILCHFGEKVAQAASQHHERLDGSGYPRGLKGNEICFNAKIIAIADVLDALTSKRVYSDVISIREAIEYLESQPEKYDENLVAILKRQEEDGTLEKTRIQDFPIEN